jgi:hypothetical protein
VTSPTTVSVNDLSMDLVRLLAPEDEPALRALLLTYEEDLSRIRKILRSNGSRELGIGVESVGALAPYVIDASMVAVGWLASNVSVGAGEAVQGSVTRLLERLSWRKRRASADIARALTASDLDAIHRVVLEACGDTNLSPSRARRLADAVVSTLARRTETTR